VDEVGFPRRIGVSGRRLVAVIWIALAVVACDGSEASPSVNLDSTGILLVGVGEQVQGGPATEALKVAFSDALVLAEANGNDLGYPWIDSSGMLVVSAVTPHGRDLIQAARIAVPHRVRDVTHGAGELRKIQDDATFLRSPDVPGAELIYETVPDYRDNRALIVISSMSRPLLEYLAAHYPVDALAVQVAPSGGRSGSPAPGVARGASGPWLACVLTM
jgi:hypothetical protein